MVVTLIIYCAYQKHANLQLCLQFCADNHKLESKAMNFQAHAETKKVSSKSNKSQTISKVQVHK